MTDEPGEPTDEKPPADGADSTPTDQEVVETAAEAAEGVIFSHYRQATVTDHDVTVTFEDGVLEIDVYVNPGDDADADVDPETVADEAARAGQDAVDELFGV